MVHCETFLNRYTLFKYVTNDLFIEFPNIFGGI